MNFIIDYMKLFIVLCFSVYKLDCKWREAGGRQCGWTDPHAESQYVVSNESGPGTCHPSKMCMY